MNKKLVAIALAVSVFAGTSALMARAGDSKSVTLGKTQTTAYSDFVSGSQVWYNGTNSTTSKHSVFVQPQYQIQGQSVKNDKYYSMNPGTDVPNRQTNPFGNEKTSWRLQLDTRLSFIDCEASGNIWE